MKVKERSDQNYIIELTEKLDWQGVDTADYEILEDTILIQLE